MSDLEFSSLAEIQEWIEARKWTGKAFHCPACDSTLKIYHRPLNEEMARSLGLLYAVHDREFAHLPTLLRRKQADETKLAYWGLMEEEKIARADGGRAGYWRVTLQGATWLLGQSVVPSHAWTYQGRCLGLDDARMVSIYDVAGVGFHLRDLLDDHSVPNE